MLTERTQDQVRYLFTEEQVEHDGVISIRKMTRLPKAIQLEKHCPILTKLEKLYLMQISEMLKS